jgi:hypothetical protein
MTLTHQKVFHTLCKTMADSDEKPIATTESSKQAEEEKSSKEAEEEKVCNEFIFCFQAVG